MNDNLKIKVCGMKFIANRQDVEELPVDFFGFIFYPKSKRYVGTEAYPDLFNSAKPKVSVFVDENIYEVLRLAKKWSFEFVQLHGKEKPAICKILKKQGIKVIKAFNMNEEFDFSLLKIYGECVDYFLFDTKTSLPGGSGEKFNWKVLQKYIGQTPFFLSGGIHTGDAAKIKQLEHPQFFGVDINSGFEDGPGLKNVEKIRKFINELKRA